MNDFGRGRSSTDRAVQTVAAATVYGGVAAVLTGRMVVWFVPELVSEPTRVVEASLPFGVLAGVLMGGFLSARGRSVRSFWRVLFETIAVMIVTAVVVSQLVSLLAWNLPRTRITTLIVGSSAVLAGIGACLLKPLYWRRRRSIQP